MELPLPKLEARLQSRYEKVVKEHLSPSQVLAAGLRALPGAGRAFASTQGLWRFLANERVTLPALGVPLLACGRELLAQECRAWGLVAHDWSELRFTSHTSKTEQLKLGKGTGYCLETALLLSDQQGSPLSPLNLHLWSSAGCYTTRTGEVLADLSRLDAISATMRQLREQEWKTPLCHLIDRAADSAGHLRAWDAAGEFFLVRGDEGHQVEWGGRAHKLSAIAARLSLRAAQAVEWDNGVVAQLLIGETAVTLTRPAHTCDAQGRRRLEKGAPLALRLVVCEIHLPDETIAARWLLLTNLPPTVSADTTADWYFWRWRIESYFKLLKSAGWHLEQWQQESPLSLAKRLCVVGMAAIVVWHLQHAQTPAAERARTLLLRLSGRQVRRGQATAPALLAGLWSLLSVLDALEHYDLDELIQIARSIEFTNSG
jgi:hypothetical protein